MIKIPLAPPSVRGNISPKTATARPALYGHVYGIHRKTPTPLMFTGKLGSPSGHHDTFQAAAQCRLNPKKPAIAPVFLSVGFGLYTA